MNTWRILLLDTKRSNPNHYICLAIERALSQRDDVETVTKADYFSAIGAALNYRCNFFLAFDGEELDRNIVKRLASVCGTSAMWVTEDPYELRSNIANMDLFDLIFTNDSGSVAAYAQKGRHLPFAADPGLHYRVIPDVDDSQHYRYDLFFAGTAWPNRTDFIRRLQSGLKGINLKLALPSNPHIPPSNLDLPASSYLWRTPNSEFARFANRSRAVLTLHRTFSSSGNDPTAHTPGPRLYEVALAGGLQFIDMSLPEIEVTKYFEEDVEFIGFRSAEECIEKLSYYLSNAEARIAIAKAAQTRALAEHLYSNRVQTLFAEVAVLPAKPPIVTQRSQQRTKILFVTHNIVGVEPYGGVEVYQDLIKDALKSDFEFLFYVPDRTIALFGKRYVIYNELLEVIEQREFDGEIPDALLSCPQRERAFSEILLKYGIKFVHFQHLIGHPPSLLYLPKALGIPSLLSLHDYFAVCTRFNLIGYKETYCNIAALPRVTCDICLNASEGIAIGSQAKRQAFFGRALEQVDVLHANTSGVADLFKAIYPTLGERMRVFGVPMPVNGKSPNLPSTTRFSNPLRIAIIGNFTKNKGADECIHALNQMRHDDVEFTIFGTISEPYSGIFQALNIPNVCVHGAYSPGTLGEKLKGFSVSMHLSIWPETYCITLSEAWQAGLVPIVSDIGALGERVVHGVNGFKVPPGESGALVEMIRALILEPERVEAARERIASDLYITISEHMAWLADLYQQLLGGCAAVPETANEALRGFALADYGVMLNHKSWKQMASGPHVVPPHTAVLSVATNESSAVSRTRGYVRKHGLLATLRRVLREVRGQNHKGGGAK